MSFAEPLLFEDDFSDGLWTKYPGNPILTRTEEWEARTICEPSVLVDDGVFKMWYVGCKTSVGANAVLGYATSKDGLTWQKHPDNPILTDPKDAVIRATVIKHDGKYYLFACDYQWNDAEGVINRWTSSDGLHWENKTTILRPSGNEAQLDNTGVIVDDDGLWKMIYATNGTGMGYAWSEDGVTWTKHGDFPVLGGFYGGDPFLKKIGETYFVWYSRLHNNILTIHCSWSTDLIHWTPVYNNPQINFTQPWERGRGCPEAHWDTLLADAELEEHDGKVYMYYAGAQCPIGVAVFDGSWLELAQQSMHPPLSKWVESLYGSVEDKQLKIAEDQTDKEPLVVDNVSFNDEAGYVLEFRARCYAGPSYQIKPVMRYVDKGNFARFWIVDNNTTWYQECVNGQFCGTAEIGANGICDHDWHEWKIVVHGETNELFLDGRRIGEFRSSPCFVHRGDLRIGFGVFDTYAAIDYVRVRPLGGVEAK